MFGGWRLTLTGVLLLGALIGIWWQLDRVQRTYEGHYDGKMLWWFGGSVEASGDPIPGAWVLAVPLDQDPFDREWFERKIEKAEDSPQRSCFAEHAGGDLLEIGQADRRGRFRLHVAIAASKGFTARTGYDGSRVILTEGPWLYSDPAGCFRGVLCVADGCEPMFVPLTGAKRIEAQSCAGRPEFRFGVITPSRSTGPARR